MAAVDIKNLIERLQPFNLDEGESTVYYHLCRVGGGRAAEVSAASKRKRPDTYRLLDALVVKGFAEKTLERPTRYIPIPVEAALQQWLDVRASETKNLADEQAELASIWPKPNAVAVPTSQRFTIYQGADQVNGLMGRMLESAQQEVTIVASPGGMARLGLRAMLNVWDGRAGAHVRVRLLTKPEAHRHEELMGLEDTAEIRYAELPSFHQMIIVDATQIALFVSGGRKLSTSGEEETVLWLNSPDFVLAQKALFDEVWATGMDHAERDAAERESRRPTTSKLLRGRWQRIDRMRRMIAHATQRVAIIAPSVETARWNKGPLAKAIKRQAAAGIQVTVWTDGDVPEGCIHVAMNEAPKTACIIVDDCEAMMVLGSLEAPEAIAHEAEWALWSTHGDLVADVQSRVTAMPVGNDIVRMS
jgi:sugar-specific transcriptional regulator TrmB